jgi:pimeloyl-ACP methyl ester carboxylesterase
MRTIQINDLLGVGGRRIAATHWQGGKEPSADSAVLFPGLSYPAEGPMNFYLKLLFLQSGWDWWNIDYRYNEDRAYLGMNPREQAEYFDAEQELIGDYLAEHLDSRRLVLIGKSLGTIALDRLSLHDRLRHAAQVTGFVILTPTGILPGLLSRLAERNDRVLLAIGERDRFYDAGVVDKARRMPNLRTLVIPDAGHIFEDVGGDIEKSIENIATLTRFVRRALTDGFPG